MVGRFKVKPADDGHGWGVFDNAVHGWRAKGLATEVEAGRVKADLDLQFDARGPRPADHVRPVDPPLPVERVTWTPTWTPTGTMDNWLWHDKGWLGRVIEPDGHIAWVPEPELRPDQTPAPAPGHNDQTGAA